MKKEYDRNNNGNIISRILAEIRDSLLFEAIWRILLFIPRMIMSVFKNWN